VENEKKLRNIVLKNGRSIIRKVGGGLPERPTFASA